MDAKAIDQLLESQRQYFLSGATLPVEFRIAMLQRLRETVRRREPDISKALTADLGKSGYEGYMCEIGLVLSELGYLIRHTRRFAKRRHVPTPLAPVRRVQLSLALPLWERVDYEPLELPPSFDLGPTGGRYRRGQHGHRQAQRLFSRHKPSH